MLPRGIYEALPWIYMAVGAITPALLDSDLKYLPALLFFVTGGVVLLLRRNARSALNRRVNVSVGRPRPR